MLTQPKLLTEAAAVRHLFLEGSLKQFDELKEATQAWSVFFLRGCFEDLMDFMKFVVNARWLLNFWSSFFKMMLWEVDEFAF